MLWYKKDDISKFRNDVVEFASLVERTREESPQHTAWLKSLWSAEEAIQSATSARDVSDLIKSAKHGMTVHPFCIGLEKWMNESPIKRSEHRKALLSVVSVAQARGAPPKALSRLCREATRSSRLWAVYLGRTVAGSA